VADGALEFRRPNGRILAQGPPPSPVSDDPVEDLRPGLDRRAPRRRLRDRRPASRGHPAVASQRLGAGATEAKAALPAGPAPARKHRRCHRRVAAPHRGDGHVSSGIARRGIVLAPCPWS
jgi:hypothetical protein